MNNNILLLFEFLILIILWISLFYISFFFTKLSRHFILNLKMLDKPNKRSLHRIPTPRGGGICIVITFTIISNLFCYFHYISSDINDAFSGGIIVAMMGWLDDMISINISIRIIIQMLSAMWAIYWLKGLPHLTVGTHSLNLPLGGYIIGIIAISWSINAYNFMDGIDGLAGMEGIYIALFTAVILAIMGIVEMSLLFFLLSAIIAGFLVWNWPPANIFIGDVGSSYLGFLFAVFAIYTENTHSLPFVFWIVITSVFLFDTTFTLLYRIIKGEKWYTSHCQHAYQCLIKSGFTHKTVTISILFINVFILSPLAYIILLYPIYNLTIIIIFANVMLALWSIIKIKFHNFTYIQTES